MSKETMKKMIAEILDGAKPIEQEMTEILWYNSAGGVDEEALGEEVYVHTYNPNTGMALLGDGETYPVISFDDRNMEISFE